MSKFKVGEIAIGHNFVNSVQFNGAEIEILEDIRPHKIGILNGNKVKNYVINGYKVLALGEIFHAKPQKLKKLPPKDEPTTWEKCVWKPTEIKESS